MGCANTVTLGLLATTLLGTAAIAYAQDIEVSTPQGSVAVEPGYSVDVPIVVTNHGAASSELELLLPPTPGDYTFEQLSQPDCGPIVPAPDGWTEFSIAPIAAGGSRTCTIRVDRGAAEINNGFAAWILSGYDTTVQFALGTFVDISYSGERVASSVDADGTIHATFRLQTTNDSAIDVADVLIALGPECGGWSIAVDTDFPGGCEATNIGCPFGGSGPGALMPVLEPGMTASCLVSYTAPPNVDLDVETFLSAGLMNAATGGYIGDDNDSNNVAVLNLRPSGALSPESTPALSWWAMFALILALTAITAGFRRTARR
ncbi:MAG TPA: hypothetical protein VGO25_04195 [Rhodanobacteraceae bacterium]|jgi:hypothetical protein|nr:hypothetical protein [Rhodanobacteraceae bacterium]